MSVSHSLRQLVFERAGSRCEYCQMPEQFDSAKFQVDHVRPEKHDGPTIESNLACARFPCNNHKGPNLSGVDPLSGAIVELFNPRRDNWRDHFVWDGPELIGTTPVGRATTMVMEINQPDRVALRRELIAEGVFPAEV